MQSSYELSFTKRFSCEVAMVVIRVNAKVIQLNIGGEP